jgi:hypothetical protein
MMKFAARNGSQFFEKWSEMVLSCWGFQKNVSRETSLVQENKTRIACKSVSQLTMRSDLGSGARQLREPQVTSKCLNIEKDPGSPRLRSG